MSTLVLPGMDDFGTRVQAFAAARGMRTLKEYEVERLNSMTDGEARATVAAVQRLGLSAGIVEAYFQQEEREP